MNFLAILLLALAQNVAFTMISRSRNRDCFTYHAIASVLSNAVWFATMHQLVAAGLDWSLFIPYTTGSCLGSILGAKISIRIERLVGAQADTK